MSFQEFPKQMTHPQHAPAVLSRDMIENGRIIKAPPGKPERFPPVFVNNADQELQYASLGYVPNGTSDPEAYRRSAAGADLPYSHQHQEFPRWMYKADENGDTPVYLDGECVMVRGMIVDTEAAQKRLHGDWFETPGQAAEFSLMEESEPATESAAEVEKRGPGRPRKEAA